ncbi:uncharacterized protein N7503_000545 [Penicillium pulvis]|uniref:uncharacterized protein n=1 Tax=Penicillium pulvis TaxID=1562058 RepID=UPI002547CD79|nr:uncharacterized protein N7503_000545 [Penicillium pulvis]KAJ5813795.1 hypothetical protein N7503_000545 [Penicillium pulvis]
MKFIIPTILSALTVVLATSSTPGADNILSRRDRECDLCKKVNGQVVNDLPESATEEDIISTLENVCSKFKSDKSECDTFLEQYSNELVSILVEEGDPERVCALLGVCV